MKGKSENSEKRVIVTTDPNYRYASLRGLVVREPKNGTAGAVQPWRFFEYLGSVARLVEITPGRDARGLFESWRAIHAGRRSKTNFSPAIVSNPLVSFWFEQNSLNLIARKHCALTLLQSWSLLPIGRATPTLPWHCTVNAAAELILTRVSHQTAANVQR